MNGGWSKCKRLLAAVTVIFIVFTMLEAVMVRKGMRIDDASKNIAYVYDASTTTTPQTSPIDDNDYSHDVSTYSAASELAAQQIQNYKDGKGIILNIHITHHAGATICSKVGHAPGTRGTPSFECRGVSSQDNVTIDFPRQSWKHNDTAKNIELVRPVFHMISWKFGHQKLPLKDAAWENPNLVSVIVMREPISRLLAGDEMVDKKYAGMMSGATGAEQQWWQYATKEGNTNNYALSKLSSGCCQHNQTNPKHLEAAKQLLSRFTFVLDIRCLHEGITAMTNILGIEQFSGRAHQKPARKGTSLVSNSDRIRFKEVYNYLLDSNKLDIELYEWSKNISLVRCDDLPPKE